MAIKIEKDYPVYTVIIDNPEFKNVVDEPTAKELADVFREIEKDEKAEVLGDDPKHQTID